MAKVIFLPPLRGILKGVVCDESPKDFSEYMKNCRPVDGLENKIRIAQGPDRINGVPEFK